MMNVADQKERIDQLLIEKCSVVKVPGMALMVAKDGETIYKHFYGYRDVDRELPVDQDTIFGVASITKSLAALAVMQLEDANKLSVDDPVIKWLPEFKTPKNQYRDDIKIKHFLSHTSGLPGMNAVNRARALSKAKDPDGEYLSGKEAVALSQEPVRNVVELMNAMAETDYELLGPPGTMFNYSNEGFAMLQEIIERASGKPLIHYMKEHIFEPLGMTRSVFRTAELHTFDNVTELYAYTHGKTDVFHSPFWWDVGDIYTNGSLKTSATDLMRYLEVYRLGGTVNGEKIISEASLKKMMTVHAVTPNGRGYGYGLQIDTHHGIDFIGHGGSIKGVSSHMKVIPKHGLTSVVLINLMEVDSENLLMTALTECLQMPMPDLTTLPSITLDDLHIYTGTYQSQEGEQLDITMEEDHLVMFTNHLQINLKPIERDRLITPSGDMIVFIRDDEDRIKGVFKGLRYIPKLT